MKLITLTQGKVAMVDDEDFERLSAFKWFYHRGYAHRADHSNRDSRSMANYVIDVPNGMIADHIDRDGLNNQRSNLRVATQAQNARNRSRQDGTSSQYKGVSWHYQKGRWRAYIYLDNKHVYLGLYDSEVAAACAYDIAALLLHGEFASINF